MPPVSRRSFPVSLSSDVSRFLSLACVVALIACTPQASANQEVAAWEQQARNVSIIRDDWGIPHI